VRDAVLQRSMFTPGLLLLLLIANTEPTLEKLVPLTEPVTVAVPAPPVLLEEEEHATARMVALRNVAARRTFTKNGDVLQGRD
jgi:hypothetical protein